MTTYYLIWFIGGNLYGREETPCFVTTLQGDVLIHTDIDEAKSMWSFQASCPWYGYYRIIEVREDEL